MVNSLEYRTELIWYNPQTRSYECGPWIRYNNLTLELGEEGFSVLYETDDLTARLAQKIVAELNAARVEDTKEELIPAFI